MEQEEKPVKTKKWIMQYPQKLLFDVVCTFSFLLIIDLGFRFWFAEDLQQWESPLPSFQNGHRILEGNPYLIFEYAPGVWEEKGGGSL